LMNLYDISFFFNVPAPTVIYTLSLHDALPISAEFLAAVRAGLGWGMWGPLPRDGARFDVLAPDDDVVPLAPETVDVTLYLQQWRSEEHTSELQSRENLVCRLLLEKKKEKIPID